MHFKKTLYFRIMIIGIGGISRSGKSILAKKLKEEFEKQHMKTVILEQDVFVLPEQSIPMIRDHVDWEVPESIDWIRLKEAIAQQNEDNEVVIVEGLMAFWDKSLLKMYDRRIFLDLDRDSFMARKRTDLRWGLEPDWYIEHIWNSFLVYGQMPGPSGLDIIIDGAREMDISKIFAALGEK
jgi:nicotinamide/nicotinate riboside kinase